MSNKNGQLGRRDYLITLAWAIGVVLLAVLLIVLGNGLPPQAWRNLMNIFLSRGVAAPWLAIVAIQSLSFLGAWIIWCLLTLFTLQRAWEHVPPSLRDRLTTKKQTPPVQVPTWARTPSTDDELPVHGSSPDQSLEEIRPIPDIQEASSALYQQNYLLFGEDGGEAEPVRTKEPKPLLLPSVASQATERREEDRRHPSTSLAVADEIRTQVQHPTPHVVTEAPSLPEHRGTRTDENIQSTSVPLNTERPQQESGEDSNASILQTGKAKPPLERLETYLAQVLAQGTPLEKVTIDMMKDGTHVKRETISNFLREKKRVQAEGKTPTTASISVVQPPPATNTLEASGATHTGITRAQQPNGDRFLCMSFPPLGRGLFVVADGMGGHANGQLASRLLIDTFELAFRQVLETIEEEAAKELMIETIYQANANILQQNNQPSSKQGEREQMGTTVTLALVFGHNAYIANVGDSRTYWQSRQHGLVRVTTDHSTVQQMVDGGMLSDEERYTHPDRSHIYRTIGQDPDVEVDAFFASLSPAECLLLCSDGLWEMVRDVDIARIMDQPSLPTEQITHSLIDAALQGGGTDNVTALVVRVA